MKKFRKKQMTRFDYKMRIIVVFSVLVFAVTAIVAYPKINSNEVKNVELEQQLVQKQNEINTANETLEDLLDNQTTELIK